MKTSILFLLIFLVLTGTYCTEQRELAQEQMDVQAYLDAYVDTLLDLRTASAEANWKSNTYIVAGDSTYEVATREAQEALAHFTGSVYNIDQATQRLESADLDTLQEKQLRAILYRAAANPQTIPELVAQRIAAETKQTKQLYGYTFTLNEKEVTPNQLDEMLTSEKDLTTRQQIWESSKAIGTTLRDGLLELRQLRNATVEPLGYTDYFAYQVSDYNMTVSEMQELCQQLVSDIWPLYRELHTYARYQLAEKYQQPVPEYLPAHWLSNRWGQDWSELVEVQGLDIDAALSDKEPVWLVNQAERFYQSLGFDTLPTSFYEKSSLYPVPDSADYKKNTHASAWHIDLQQDVRCLMSVEPNARWYETTHHELGHIYYYLSYSRPKVPILLRGGANRAYHEAVGSLMGLAAMQQPFLEEIGLIQGDAPVDSIQSLLREAMNFAVFIPWSAGVMTSYEKALYSDQLDADSLNAYWWKLKKNYQGIVPPTDRDEAFTDAASKTHINNDAAQYYDYAISFVLLFQMHQHISEQVLHQPPSKTNYFGSTQTGDFLRTILEQGATEDWRHLIKRITGDEIRAEAMLTYFEPVLEYLKQENAGRTHTLPEHAPSL